MAFPQLPLGGYDPYLTARALGATPGNALVPTGIEVLQGTPMQQRALTAGERAAQIIDAVSRPASSGPTAAGRAAAEARLAAAAAGTSGTGPIAAGAAPSIAGAAPGAASAAGGGSGAIAAAAQARMAAGGAGAVEQAAARGLLPRLLGGGGGGRLATAFTAGRLAPGSLGRGGLYGLAGQLAGQGIERVVGHREGTLDDALRNTATGAGLGAGIGSVILPGPGTAIGAGLGAVGGFGYGLLTGSDSDATEAARQLEKETDKFFDAFSRYRVSGDTKQQFLMQFNLAADGLKKGEIKELATQMRTQVLPNLILEDAAMQQDQRSQAAMYAAAQAWMQPMMQDAFNRSTTFGNDLSALMTENAGAIPNDNARRMALEDAARIPLDVAQTQQAYMQQLMALPGLYGYNTQLNNQGVPQTDFTSILNATPINPVATPTAGALPASTGRSSAPFAAAILQQYGARR